MNSEGIMVAIWPDGVWCSMEEERDFEFLLSYKSDDYYLVEVTQWTEDGSPAAPYFR